MSSDWNWPSGLFYIMTTPLSTTGVHQHSSPSISFLSIRNNCWKFDDPYVFDVCPLLFVPGEEMSGSLMKPENKNPGDGLAGSVTGTLELFALMKMY